MIVTAILYLFVLSFLGTVVGGCCCSGGTNIYDTGQTCCTANASLPARYCCISDQSTLSVGPLPTITYAGAGPTADLVNWYTTNYAGTTVNFPGCNWRVDITDGDFSITFVATLSSFRFGFISTTTGAINPRMTTLSTSTCCGFSGHNWVDDSGTAGVTITDVTITGTITNNNCCQDTLHGGFGGSPCDNTLANCGCLKSPPLCTGECNPFP